MSTPATAAAVLRTQGLQFVRLFQGSLRLVMLYSADHNQTQAMIQRAIIPLLRVLQETPTLSIGFQFDNVVLNSLPVSDPQLAPLARELVKRRVGFLVFSEGIDHSGLARVLSVLGTKAETIEEKGGLVKFLRSNPLEHARIVPIQLAAAEGSLAVVTSAEEAAAMAKIPRWLLRALQDIQTSGAAQVVGAMELATLAQSLSPDMTPEQRILLPQLQDLLAKVVQRADLSALTELIRAASVETGGAGEELLQSVLLQGLIASVESGEQPQAERILRTVSHLKIQPESLLQMVPPGKATDEMRASLLDFITWLHRPVDEQLAQLSATATAREFRWLVLEIENDHQTDQPQQAADLLLALFTASGPQQEAERAEALTRGRHLLEQICAGGLPHNAQSLMDDISIRLREETGALVAAPLVESIVVLTQTAAERHEYALATQGAGLIVEIAEEFSPRGRLARQAHSELLKPATLSQLARTAVLRKDDPTVNRSIVPLLKKVGDHAARELLVLLEKEPVAARRFRILQVVKLLGKSAADALSEKITDPQWFIVRNAVNAIAELADPSLLDRLEPALSHPDLRVQQAAVSAALKTRSPLRGLQLARALPAMKPAVLDTVLDDLLVLKDTQAAPFLEKFLRQPGEDARPHLLQKAVAALWSIGSEEAVTALANTAADPSVSIPLRQAALRALGRLELPSARTALQDFARTTTDAALAAEANKLSGA